jgi:hypothetical protein
MEPKPDPYTGAIVSTSVAASTFNYVYNGIDYGTVCMCAPTCPEINTVIYGNAGGDNYDFMILKNSIPAGSVHPVTGQLLVDGEGNCPAFTPTEAAACSVTTTDAIGAHWMDYNGDGILHLETECYPCPTEDSAAIAGEGTYCDGLSILTCTSTAADPRYVDNGACVPCSNAGTTTNAIDSQQYNTHSCEDGMTATLCPGGDLAGAENNVCGCLAGAAMNDEMECINTNIAECANGIVQGEEECDTGSFVGPDELCDGSCMVNQNQCLFNNIDCTAEPDGSTYTTESSSLPACWSACGESVIFESYLLIGPSTPGTYDGEVSYQVWCDDVQVGDTYSAANFVTQEIFPVPSSAASCVIKMFDSWGDGWNGYTLTVNSVSLTIETGLAADSAPFTPYTDLELWLSAWRVAVSFVPATNTCKCLSGCA